MLVFKTCFPSKTDSEGSVIHVLIEFQTKSRLFGRQDWSKPLTNDHRASLSPQTQQLYDNARHKPSVIQNRFYAETQFDGDIRQFCREKNIFYQSFWTLTANPQILNHPLVKQLAQQRHGTSAQVLFRFLLDIGLTPLTGTTNEQHMKEDLDVLEWPSLDNESIEKLKRLIHD